MKAIINGVKYDTSTATCIGVYSYVCGSNLDRSREELYQKKNGEFFLYGEGGPFSIYAAHSGYDFWGTNSMIIPMMGAEAREWAERHCSVEDYEAVFGVVAE